MPAKKKRPEELKTSLKRMASMLKYQNSVITRPCIMCGASTELRRKIRPYCSDECKIEYLRSKRPQTFKECEQCNKEFGPVEYLAKRFCSYECKVKAQTTGRKLKSVPTRIARNAQRLVKYYIDSGKLVRPTTCEFCGQSKKIEAAHKDYSRPLDVFWLCRPCHIKYDKRDPKGGSYSIKRNGELMEWTI